jgi:predicted nuclease with TOPRIM domain
MGELQCSGCGDYVGSEIADRIEALEVELTDLRAKADALAEAVEVLASSLHPLEDEDNLRAVFSASKAYRATQGAKE